MFPSYCTRLQQLQSYLSISTGKILQKHYYSSIFWGINVYVQVFRLCLPPKQLLASSPLLLFIYAILNTHSLSHTHTWLPNTGNLEVTMQNWFKFMIKMKLESSENISLTFLGRLKIFVIAHVLHFGMKIDGCNYLNGILYFWAISNL